MDFGSLSAGAYLPARAGLPRGKRVFSCAGGAASMALMLYRVHAELGPELANRVADQMVCSDSRSQSQAQRRVQSVATRVRRGRLAMAPQIMDNNTEGPLTPDEIADLVGLSTRSITEVAAACGFRSVSHFSRGYRRAFDVSPSRQSTATDLAWTPGPR